jgi:hypothetical protein
LNPLAALAVAVSAGLLLSIGIGVLVIVTLRRREKAEPSTTVPALSSEVVIHPPYTPTGLTGLRFREDTLLDFAPMERREEDGTFRRFGVYGVPFNAKGGPECVGRFLGGARLSVRLDMEAWNAPPYSAPARHDTLYTWNDGAGSLIPLAPGETTDTPHVRVFPGCAGKDPHGAYVSGARGPQTIPSGGRVSLPPQFAHPGLLRVAVEYLGQRTDAAFPVLVWIQPAMKE